MDADSDYWKSHPANRGAKLNAKMSAILSSCAGGAIFGYSAGVIGGISEGMIKDVFFPDESKDVQGTMTGLLTACVLIGAFIGCFAVVWAANKWGRRFALRLTGLVCMFGATALAFIPGFGLIVVARTVLGLAVGAATALCPWYVTESVPANVRGSIGTVFQLNVCGFILLAQIVNFAFHPDASDTNIHISEWKWRLQLAMSFLPGFAAFIISFLMMESPVYLQTVDEQTMRADSAADQFGYANGGSVSVSTTATSASESSTSTSRSMHTPVAENDEGTMMGNNLMTNIPVVTPAAGVAGSGAAVAAVTEKAGFSVLFSRAHIKWVWIGLILSVTNQLTGINAIIFYAPKIFQDAGLANPLIMTFAVVGTWNLLAVFISFVLVDRMGRRPLMLGSVFGMALGLGLMALAYAAFPQSKAPAAIVAIIIFIGSFECGPGPLFFIMAVETFPPSLRDPALAFTQNSMWVCSILVTFCFPVMNESLGNAATFLVFFIICIFSFVMIWWMVPEPHGSGPAEQLPTHDERFVGVDGSEDELAAAANKQKHIQRTRSGSASNYQPLV